jgi:DNA mismatch repair protein MSH4
VNSIRTLEILVDEEGYGRSLFHSLNSTLTTSGSRLLRGSLLQPSADVNCINDRLDAVDELLGKQEVTSLCITVACRCLSG